MASCDSEYYASNDETKGDSIDGRESYPSSFESTPSDFDENDSEKFRMMTEIELLKIYVSFLNEMNTDLVFMEFETLRIVHFFLISKLTYQEFDSTRMNKFIDDLGKRMIMYSKRVNIEAIFLLTDLLDKIPRDYKSTLSTLLMNENILNVVRMLLSTTCHLTIRSVLNFIYKIAVNITDGFGKIKLCLKLKDKIVWIAEKKHPLNYLSSPAISKGDKTIEKRLKTEMSDFSVYGTHSLAKEIMTLFKKRKI